MERKFWVDRWKRNQIGFHQVNYNVWLTKYWGDLGLPSASPVFVPMCGKSLDMRWLEQQGHLVRGIDLAGIALEAYFEEGHEEFRQVAQGLLTRYEGRSSVLFCGDFFELTAVDLAGVSAVFDRGALVALGPSHRGNYVDHMLRVLPERSQILLVTLEYDQHLVSGPPFSVLPEEVETLYENRCSIEVLESATTDLVPPHFQAHRVESAVECVYRIIKEH
ncbi:MAG: thiopurine S-methyltransferase [Gammaproteobacteria bacterium]|nr:thiopurine S-methyltransferase [Gammaproteobacteria bacterium]